MKWLYAVGIVLLTIGASDGTAQTFPARPVRFVVPFAPGGNTDMMARTLGQKVTENLRQNVIIENRGGAATLVGAEVVATAPPDGYTILLATSTTLAINPHLYRKLPYDPSRDFAPIMLIGRTPLVLVLHPSVPVKNIKELLALARAKPGQLTYGTGGTGSQSFMAMAMLRNLTQTDMIEVPYKGSGPADIDLLSGQIAMMFQNTAAEYIKAGRLRAIAQSGEKRMATLPDVPTIEEAGVKGCVFYSWQGIVAPAATPPAAVKKLNDEFNKALTDAAVRTRMSRDGAELFGGTPEHFAQYIKSETVRFGKLIRDVGVRPN
jgi:tripartite-type tricarboxylate transporter receptor subunit TctC